MNETIKTTQEGANSFLKWTDTKRIYSTTIIKTKTVTITPSVCRSNGDSGGDEKEDSLHEEGTLMP